MILNDCRISSIHCKIYKGVELDDETHEIVVEDVSSNGIRIQRTGQVLLMNGLVCW